ncbi:maleylpyruvate isomerase family mycothiol-dependent enzyme [Nonomuraea sp. MCN248]|uniref:Maleylpyruvate isomerase family mycothiol-dependent enzyme n=1 Tax=Nonomuraea corallina TaxID=2989783 RepID=A0ABT4SJ87_9ACTN|nr:maleylpyruvate isomerase family mycothiol-dependent enzyme [Nonomuraea corallina]MDA0637083.1 maleylpyruvate isomerase family mycothiol-dependent enzyme [Nonomuraea corallina]
MPEDLLREYDPFDIFDAEASRLDWFFAGLDEEGWRRPSRAAGWTVRDVLGHLAGEELYNQACLDGTMDDLRRLMESEGIAGYNEFNEWCVRQRRGLPVEDVLKEWRDKNGDTRRRMRALGRDALLETMAGPYPVGKQTFHYASEYATHADDVGAPVRPDEEDARTFWRIAVGRFALAEQDTRVQIEQTSDEIWVHFGDAEATLSYPQFVEATVGRLPEGQGVSPRLVSALRCLA